MKIEIRNGAEIRISGYVNAVERDSRVLPPEMAVGASSRFVEKVGAGAFKRALARNPNVRLYFNHEREIGSEKGGELSLFEDNIGLHAEAVITDAEVVAAAKRGELRGWSFGFSGAKSSWEDVGENLKRRTLVGFDTAALRSYPELILIEFGRPGKSPIHSKNTDKLGRKKGKFPEGATVMPIRAGFYLAHENALSVYADEMFDRISERFRR